MSLSNGRSYLAIPGPSVMPDAVLRAMHRAAPNIYEGELIEMTAGLIPDLKWVARTDGHVAIYIANGHGAWEAALANTLAPGDAVLVPATGRFGHGWADMAQALGVETDVIDFGRRAPLDPARVAEVKARYGLPVMKVLGVAGPSDFDALLDYQLVADQILIDAKPPKDAVLPGGNGLTFDWQLLVGRKWLKPWMLAGGLTPENVEKAVRLTGAKQVDVASGVESAPGIKDAEKIAAFVKRANNNGFGTVPILR